MSNNPGILENTIIFPMECCENFHTRKTKKTKKMMKINEINVKYKIYK